MPPRSDDAADETLPPGRPASDFPIVPSPAAPLDPNAPGVQLFHFGALIMRVDDNGALHADILVGWNRGLDKEQAQGEFAAAVRQSRPGFAITKIMGGDIPPTAPEQG